VAWAREVHYRQRFTGLQVLAAVAIKVLPQSARSAAAQWSSRARVMTATFCQGMTSVMPQVPQNSTALAAEVLFFQFSQQSLKGFMYRENLSIGMAQGDSEKIMLSRAMNEAKRWARNVFGFALLVLGIIAIPTPGPGGLLFMLGLATLAAEFEWARKLLQRAKDVGLRLRAAFAPRRVAPDP
jgi:Putative transmembrane protein (PGPGW)